MIKNNWQVYRLVAAPPATEEEINQLFLSVISCSVSWSRSRQCVVYSAWLSVQPDPAAAAGLPLQSRLLGPWSVPAR